MKKLSDYKKKRKAGFTPEPMYAGGAKGELIFVVQKHNASHLHYDLRLELDGVLVSWAVPKGMPQMPGEKRLAVKVEDHPFEYKDFSAEIPVGNYGAGTVEIWDEGNYIVPGTTDSSDAQKQMRAGLKKGHLVFVLLGKRLQGEFHLVRMAQNGQPKAWLLFRKATENPKLNKRPSQLSPMLCQLVDRPFNRAGWLFEVKWDGYRILADVQGVKTRLLSRNNKSYTRKFAPIVRALVSLEKHAPILDGEVVVLDELGRSDFHELQNYPDNKQGSLHYYVFDLLFCDGQDLRDRPLIERKERLEILLRPLRNTHVRYSDHVYEKGIQFFKEAVKLELEGIIAKNSLSTYQMSRSKDWQKIKKKRFIRVAIGGFTAPRSSRLYFGSLMVGVVKGRELHYIGLVGAGFSEEELRGLRKKFESLIRKRTPFSNSPKINPEPTYLKAKLICKVSFSEWTKDGMMRHPVYEGLVDVDES